MVKTGNSDNRFLRAIEYSIEALIIGWLSYLLIYQNYLLYRWHRGLPKPSRGYFILAGFVIGVSFLSYELIKMFRSGKAEPEETIDKPENEEE